jgi:putative ABC transport system permease protein
METFWQDVRFAARMLAKSPGFTAVAVLTLALGIGANTAIFSVVDAVLLRRLPVDAPERLVVIHNQLPKVNLPRTEISALQFLDYAARTDVFESAAAITFPSYNLTGTDQPLRLRGMRATAGLFPVLGVRPLAGRVFTAAEDTYGGPHVVLLSQNVAERMYGSDQGSIEKRLQLDGESYEIIGVMPRTLEVIYPDVELWTPMAFTPRELNEERRWSLTFGMLGRLRRGVNLAAARATMGTMAARMNGSMDASIGAFGIEVRPFVEEHVGDVRQPLYILLGAVSLVLLIACANIANLLLARGTARSREMAIRGAMGAARGRIVTQLLTESLLLAVLGGALGLLIAEWGCQLLIRMAPANLLRSTAIGLDPAVLLFTLGVSVIVGVLFGLAPALEAARKDLAGALKEGGRGTREASGRQGLRKALVISEIALAIVLLICSGLLLRSFGKLLEVKPGFDPTNVLTAQVSLPRTKYTDEAKLASFSNALLARVSSLPGVLHAAMADQPPLTPGADNSVFSIRDYHPGPKDPQPHADTIYATPDYFAAMRIPLLQGRTYLESEMRPQKGPIGEGSVVVIDEALAKIFWGHESALGKQLGWWDKGPWATIVGVVGTVRSGDLAEESKGTIYFPYHAPEMTLVVRTVSDPRPFVAAIRQQVQRVDPDQPVYDIKTMDERVAASVERRRFSATLLGLFAGLAFALALIGLNGVISYLVAQRTHEIGVRLALGARPSGVLRLILSQALGMASAGVVAGLIAAAFATRLLASQLYGVQPDDPATFLVVPAVLTAAALAASSIPAWRATRVDPLVALRYE